MAPVEPQRLNGTRSDCYICGCKPGEPHTDAVAAVMPVEERLLRLEADQARIADQLRDIQHDIETLLNEL